MKKILLSLFVAFKLLLAPVVAHAYEAACEGDAGQVSEQASSEKAHTDLKKVAQPDGNEMAGAGHHCCCQHVSANDTAGLSGVESVSGQAAFSLQHLFMRAVDQGPPLKPPSRV